MGVYWCQVSHNLDEYLSRSFKSNFENSKSKQASEKQHIVY